MPIAILIFYIYMKKMHDPKNNNQYRFKLVIYYFIKFHFK